MKNCFYTTSKNYIKLAPTREIIDQFNSLSIINHKCPTLANRFLLTFLDNLPFEIDEGNLKETRKTERDFKLHLPILIVLNSFAFIIIIMVGIRVQSSTK